MSRHPDFKTLEASRPAFPEQKLVYSKTPNPDWKPCTPAPTNNHTHISLDPNDPARAPGENYKLLISAVVPRPVGFVSTVSPSGHRNLAPFSYFQVANHDPPIFTIGFAGENDKDSLRNLKETRECTINIISEDFIEAANYCSVDSPPEVSEWDLSGLTPAETEFVKAPRVKESVFAVECQLVHTHEWTSKRSGKKTGVLAIVEGVKFWVRDDAYKNGMLDLEVLKPVARMGGVTYAMTRGVWELPRPRYEEERKNPDVKAVEDKGKQNGSL
ncbi:hypothetical protein FPQ18DRAFT_302423 [Pyronema domesticum]|uniref:Similar to Uncharacterized protein BH2278 acc. no. Q9KAK9 n=1 Tax=Pyronema omphalodes (strain CBS 100304) TaxID=1076935 RepID=U4LL38_PYROM|nr:hypothetical protein FPQ18DRAFT_302423 [Pyronema domesticum]CCX32804.1 Similar to Uncharacterized protein BH2278; acc. no. Q9KAK9 [Pyronema omphalodes CBS 100304]